MNKKFKIALFASGNGTNAEAVFRYFKDHSSIEVVLLLSNNPKAYALERAKKQGIETKNFNRQQFHEPETMLNWLLGKQVTHLVLAGFLWLIPEYLIKAFPHGIINIHPALLPHYGGPGMYGMKVHESVKLMNEKETGITVHEVNEKYDEGKVLFQATCSIGLTDTIEEIAANVHQLEHTHYPQVIEQWIQKSIS